MMDRPRVGVGVIILRDEMVLLNLRKGARGEGTWAFTGGHLEFGESVMDCAKREAMEEAGVELIDPVKSPFYTETIFEGKHYITLYVISECDGDPEIKEPDKCEAMGWFNITAPPENLFTPTKAYLQQHLEEIVQYQI